MRIFDKKWKIFTIIMVILVCASMIFGIIANATNNEATNGEVVTALDVGFTDIPFSNGYFGYCLDREFHGASLGGEFTVTSASNATDNISNANISNKLKALFTQYFSDLFVSDGNGGYTTKNTNTIQAIVWRLTEGNQYVWGEQKRLFEAVENYSGPEIPNTGYKTTLDTGEVITFYFMVLSPYSDGTQEFFAYYFTVTPANAHTHEWGDWVSDNNQHWHECECGEKSDIANHNTSTIGQVSNNCVNTGYTGDIVCTVCNKTVTPGVSIPALGHDMSGWYQTKASTCTSKGTEQRDCLRTNCNYFETRDINMLPHVEVVDKEVEATCTTTGLTSGKHCDKCGITIIAQTVIPMLGHDIIVDEAVTVTCTTNGLTAGEHCSRCDYKITQNTIPANGHTMNSWFVVTEATCIADGFKKSDCVYCSYFETDTISKLGHDMVTDAAVTPTCVETGLTEGSHCSRCDYKIAQKVVDALGHNMGEWYITKQPTCTENGTEQCDCSRCEYFEIRDINMNGHNEVVDKAVVPTCTETGLTEGKHCDVCDTVIVKQNTIPALGHNMITDEAVSPTCEHTGLTEGSHCDRCDYTIAQKVVDALGHDMSDWHVSTNPTCTETGIKHSDCLRDGCDYCIEQEIAATGHTAFTLRAVAPTCTKTGLTEGVECSVCHETLTEQEIIDSLGHLEALEGTVFPTCTDFGYIGDIVCTRCNSTLTVGRAVPALGHDMSEWYQTKASTCTKEGEEQSDCQRDNCQHIETRDVDTLPHAEVVDNSVDATCTTDGLTEGKHCESCGEVIIEQNIIPAFGHDMIVDSAIDATCLQSGLTKGSHCSRCDHKVEQENIYALGHNMGEWYVTKEPTCSEEGEERSECSRCEHHELRPISALAHTEVVNKAINPDCITNGLTEGKYCEICNTIIVIQDIIPALGHNMSDWYIVKEATYDEEGMQESICQREHCEYKEQKTIPIVPKPYFPNTGEELPGSPQTGDKFSIGIYITLMFVSILGMVGIFVLKKVKR